MGIPAFPGPKRAGFAFLFAGGPPPPPPAGPHVVPPFPFPQGGLDPTYGIDVKCLNDLDPYLSLTNALPQDLYHLITEQPGSLFWAPNSSFSILMLLSQGMNPASIGQVQASLQAVIQADERVGNCQAVCTFDGEETIEAKISVVPNVGQPFNLVLGITKVSITLISVGYVNL